MVGREAGDRQVSRTPFREAIGILAKGGLVEIRPYRGFYVRSFSCRQTADLYELFKQLECFAVGASDDHDRRRYEEVRFLVEGQFLGQQSFRELDFVRSVDILTSQFSRLLLDFSVANVLGVPLTLGRFVSQIN